MAKKQIRLSEEKLRNLISYSVAKILKESSEWIDDDYAEDTPMKGTSTHFDGSSSFQPKNPYENMTWDEFCQAKRKEREGNKELRDTNYPKERDNRGTKVHFGSKRYEETPKDEDLTEMVSRENCLNKKRRRK